MKSRVAFSVAVFLMSCFILPQIVQAAQVEGTVQGLTCVTQDKLCPLGQEDPVVAAEEAFVVLTEEGKYYFVPNLSKSVMARHIRETVRVTGKMHDKYNSIQAKTFEVKKDGEWKTTWSKEMEEEWRKKMDYGT